MSNQNEAIYVGSGKQTNENYINISIKESACQPHWFEYKGEKYLRLTVAKRKEVDQYGKTHNVKINNYNPEGATSKPSGQAVSAGTGLPF
jgi:hypothetical protein